MTWNPQSSIIAILLFIGVLCHAIQLPFMPFFLVEVLAKPAWHIALYTAILTPTTLLVNRFLSHAIDRGQSPSRYILIPLTAYIGACASVLLINQYELKLVLSALLFGISGSGPTTFFSLARLFAEQNKLDVTRYNAFLRATSSFAWMLGPALAFGLVSVASASSVFLVALILSLVWAVGSFSFVRGNLIGDHTPDVDFSDDNYPHNRGVLILGVCACWLISVAHSITSSALPLFYVQEAMLPNFAPGLSFSIKTLVEIFAIFLTPYLMRRIGARNSLILSCILALVAFLILINVETLPIMFLGATFEGFYYGIFAGIGITYIQNLSGSRPAAGTALYMNSLILGSLVSGPAVGIIAETADFRTAIQVSFITILVAILVLYRIKDDNI